MSNDMWIDIPRQILYLANVYGVKQKRGIFSNTEEYFIGGKFRVVKNVVDGKEEYIAEGAETLDPKWCYLFVRDVHMSQNRRQQLGFSL